MPYTHKAPGACISRSTEYWLTHGLPGWRYMLKQSLSWNWHQQQVLSIYESWGHKCWRGWPQSGMNIIEIRSVWDTISSYFILDLQTTEHEALLSEQVLVQTRWWSDTVQSHNIITTSAGLQLVLAELARSGSKGSSLWESNLLKPSFSLACRAKPWQLPHEPLLAYLTRHSRPKKKSGTSSLHYVYIYTSLQVPASLTKRRTDHGIWLACHKLQSELGKQWDHPTIAALVHGKNQACARRSAYLPKLTLDWTVHLTDSS